MVFLFDAFFGLIIWLPYSLILGVNFADLARVLVFALISAILSEAFYFFVISKGEISLTGTIFASFPIYTILFSLLINHERPTLVHWLFILITVIGTVIISLPEKFRKSELRKKGFIIWAILGALAVGLADSLSKNVIDKFSVYTFLFGISIMQVPVALGYLELDGQDFGQLKSVFRKFGSYKLTIVGALLNCFATLFLYLAFQKTYTSVASPIIAAYPALMVILSSVFLKERTRWVEKVGIGVVVVGVVGISFFE